MITETKEIGDYFGLVIRFRLGLGLTVEKGAGRKPGDVLLAAQLPAAPAQR